MKTSFFQRFRENPDRLYLAGNWRHNCSNPAPLPFPPKGPWLPRAHGSQGPMGPKDPWTPRARAPRASGPTLGPHGYPPWDPWVYGANDPRDIGDQDFLENAEKTMFSQFFQGCQKTLQTRSGAPRKGRKTIKKISSST